MRTSNRRVAQRVLRASVGSTEASNADFKSSCRKPRFCTVVETLA